ncbi:MAG: condensation domain-containing protein, partial [Owenweeksia sp.]
LSRICNSEDIVIGTPVSGREHPDLDGIVGMFVNTLALRNFPRADLKFIEFLDSVRDKTLQCFDHQNYQFEDLIEDLSPTRDLGRSPIFDVMLAFQNFSSETLTIPDLKLEKYEPSVTKSKFDLTLLANESEGELRLSFNY